MTDSAVLGNLEPVDVGSANPAQHALLASAMKQIGFIPNMYANMVHVPAVLDTYLSGYQRFRQESGFAPAEQEVILLTISMANGCRYCAAAHSMLADKVSGVPEPVWRAIREGAMVPDARLAALHSLTKSLVENHGVVCPVAFRSYLDAGFPATGLLYIILAAAVKTLSNFSNHAFATEVDPQFSAYTLN